jgi:hypothetical protein
MRENFTRNGLYGERNKSQNCCRVVRLDSYMRDADVLGSVLMGCFPQKVVNAWNTAVERVSIVAIGKRLDYHR